MCFQKRGWPKSNQGNALTSRHWGRRNTPVDVYYCTLWTCMIETPALYASPPTLKRNTHLWPWSERLGGARRCDVQSVLPPALHAEDAAAMLQAHLPGTAKALKPTEGGGGGASAVGGVVLLETVPARLTQAYEPFYPLGHSKGSLCIHRPSP